MRVTHGWATATGPRPDNQDRCAAGPTWAVVSDGAGGHRGGALAATLTVDAVAPRLAAAGPTPDEDLVVAAVEAAHAAVRARQDADMAVADMAATVTLAVAAEPGRRLWLVANVGDSPAWLAGPAGAVRVTQDHNAAAELVRAGVLTADEARTSPGRHLITRAIGGVDPPAADVALVTVPPGGRLVLASDGLGVLDEPAIMEVVADTPEPPTIARRLVAEALAGGTSDNVTVVVVGPADR
jgi:PPM family protein phosphatase